MRWWDGTEWGGRVLQRRGMLPESDPVTETEPPPEGTPPPAERSGPPAWLLALIVLAVMLAVALALALLAGST